MKDGNMVKIALHYGAMSGLAIFAFLMGLHFAGYNIFGSGSIFGIWIPIVFIVLATKYYRDHVLGGNLTYGQGFTIGLFTSIFSATLFGLAFYIFGTLLDHSVLDIYKIQTEQSLAEGKGILSESLYEKVMDSIDLVTISSLSFSESFNKLLGGVIISLVTAGVFSRKKILPA